MMEALKQKLFDVLAKAISLQEFENWLYNNESITSSINDNDMFFDIVSMNYRGKHIYSELKKYCYKYYDAEEFLISLVESSCRKLIEARTSEEVWPIVIYIGSFMDYDKGYWLINQFYYLEDDLSLVQHGYYQEKGVIKSIKNMAEFTLKELNQLSMDEKKNRLKTGLYANDSMVDFHNNEAIVKSIESKKWYEFWK